MINLASLLFYIFAAVSVASAVMVISSRNPVHSVLFLILIFFNVAGLFVLIGAEFLAFLLIMVYVGAMKILHCPFYNPVPDFTLTISIEAALLRAF